MTIADLFKSLLGRIEPTEAELQTFEGHRHTVTRRLQTVYGEKTSVVRIGSFSRGSAVRSSSDYDLLFNLSVKYVEWGNGWKSSSTVLNEVRSQLQDRYFQTAVGKDGLAIVIAFGDGKFPVDVVPAVYKGPHPHNNYPVYWIPDGEGNWIETSPQFHNKYINDEDDRSAGKLKYVAKLIKFWRICRSPRIPLNSFHMELLLAQEGTCVGPKSYASCLADVLTLLCKRECRALQDPLGISGYIKAANTEAKRDQTLEAVSASAERAEKAVAAERDGDPQEAFRLWDLVFNRQFPRS